MFKTKQNKSKVFYLKHQCYFIYYYVDNNNMEKSTSEITKEYINEHPFIKNCLKKGLINHSSLSRYISKELNIGKESSKEAILVSSCRLQEKLEKDLKREKEISKLLSNSEIEIKNKIIVFILEKEIEFETILNLQEKIKKESGLFFILEGSDNYTLITQEKFFNLFNDKLKNKILKMNKNLVLINIKSPKEIENTPGVVAYLSSLFAENGVNIQEFLSCWTDTIFIIDNKNLEKTIKFLKF
jgi:aspartokinase